MEISHVTTAEWNTLNKIAIRIISSTVTSDILIHIMNIPCAYGMWVELENRFCRKDMLNRISLRRSLWPQTEALEQSERVT